MQVRADAVVDLNRASDGGGQFTHLFRLKSIFSTRKYDSVFGIFVRLLPGATTMPYRRSLASRSRSFFRHILLA